MKAIKQMVVTKKSPTKSFHLTKDELAIIVSSLRRTYMEGLEMGDRVLRTGVMPNTAKAIGEEVHRIDTLHDRLKKTLDIFDMPR